MNCVVASEKSWNRHLVPDLSRKLNGVQFTAITRAEDFTLDALRKISPRYVFIPHWSRIIPAAIFETFECVVLHMTDLPFGRGGSPLQNLIDRGLTHTKISALRVVKEIDAGPVYLKRELCLSGTAEEIFLRASHTMVEMIETIVRENPVPQPQVGEPTVFMRRKPDQSSIHELNSIDKVYDRIRMLDAEGYPAAFLETDEFRFEFSRASLKAGGILADVRIIPKSKDHANPRS